MAEFFATAMVQQYRRSLVEEFSAIETQEINDQGVHCHSNGTVMQEIKGRRVQSHINGTIILKAINNRKGIGGKFSVMAMA